MEETVALENKLTPILCLWIRISFWLLEKWPQSSVGVLLKSSQIFNYNEFNIFSSHINLFVTKTYFS